MSSRLSTSLRRPFILSSSSYPFLHCHICYVNRIYSFPQTEDSLDNELCYYTYTGGQVDGEVLLLHIVLFCNSIPTLCHLIIRFSVDCYQPHQVKSVDVSYDLKCEDAPSHYGHGYGKDQSKVKMSTMSHGWHPMSRITHKFDQILTQVCYNKPKISPATSSITLETPVSTIYNIHANIFQLPSTFSLPGAGEAVRE